MKHKTVTVSIEVYQQHDRLRERLRKVLAARDLSWTNYWSMVAGLVEGDIAGKETNAIPKEKGKKS